MSVSWLCNFCIAEALKYISLYGVTSATGPRKFLTTLPLQKQKMDRNPPPANVSPLIKGARWTFLIAGVVYGASRYRVLLSKEKKRAEELERTRPEREAKKRADDERRTKQELEELGKQLGNPIN